MTYTVTWSRNNGEPEQLVCTKLTIRTAFARLMGAIDYSGPITVHAITRDTGEST